MHLFNVAVVFVLLLLVGFEFSVSAFVNPSAWRLETGSQSRMLSHFAAVMGRVMPVWYAAGLVLLGVETWLYRQTPNFAILLTASAIWLLTLVATMLFLVPLNNRVVTGAARWQGINHTWDRRHRVRIVALAIASILVAYALVW